MIETCIIYWQSFATAVCKLISDMRAVLGWSGPAKILTLGSSPFLVLLFMRFQNICFWATDTFPSLGASKLPIGSILEPSSHMPPQTPGLGHCPSWWHCPFSNLSWGCSPGRLLLPSPPHLPEQIRPPQKELVLTHLLKNSFPSHFHPLTSYLEKVLRVSPNVVLPSFKKKWEIRVPLARLL